MDASERRGFQDGVDFLLGAMMQLTERMREREREGERHNQKKSQYNSIYKNIENVKYVCMKMHKHVICNSKNIIGLAQSNPTSTHACNKVNTHLRTHETLL